MNDSNEIVANNVFLDGAMWKILGGGNSFTVPVNEGGGLSVGKHVLRIESIDARRSKSEATVEFEVLAK